jgi:diketogulonate reductase-like aldo/keto reductase
MSSGRKRKATSSSATAATKMADDHDKLPSNNPSFRETTAVDAKALNDGVLLKNSDKVILPWIGYGTYKLKHEIARDCTLEAIRQGYRGIDTAFIYGRETTEKQVGLAIQDAIEEGIVERKDLCVITKHWRKYHGYEPSMECLRLSLKRLQLDYIDLWLMHWPGPAWKTMNRRNDLIAEHGAWHYAVHSKEEIPEWRAETWRAMEDACKDGKVRAIGVCNFTIQHLERLKTTATMWPPAVNQIECHPLFPQQELLEYCAKEGILVQAYSSLGGQDAGKKFYRELYPLTKGQKVKDHAVTSLANTPPVLALANEVGRTAAQVLLRWALEQNLALVPKTSTKERMIENAQAMEFSLTKKQIAQLGKDIQDALTKAAAAEGVDIKSMARLCWRNDPLRDLDFD